MTALMEPMRLSSRTARRLEQVSQHSRPMPIPSAEWQAGVTEDNEKFRVLLNGEPLTLCYAASARGGWAMCYLPHVGSEGYAFDLLRPGQSATLRGKVEIVPIRHRESPL